MKRAGQAGRERIGAVARALWRRRGPLLVVAGLGLYALLLPTAWMYADTGRYRTSVDGAPAAPVGIVFGAGAPGGKPSRMLVERLDIGRRLYATGRVKVLLVTGDNSRKDYDEPTAMRDYLVAHGVPKDKIVLDYAGFNTWDSCVRAKKIFGVSRAILVTQEFHLPRAVTLCRVAGIAAWGVGDDSWRYDPSLTASLYVREVAAGVEAAYDAAFDPRPYFLGPHELGIQRALATRG